MTTVLDMLRAATPSEPIHPAGSGELPIVVPTAPVAPQPVGTLPPPAPCRNLAGELDLFADPSAQPARCGCPLFWLDAYQTLRCCECEPAPHRALVRRRLAVVITHAGPAWIDHETREPVGLAPPDRDPDRDGRQFVGKLLDDPAGGWTIVRPRHASPSVPIDRTTDEWWEWNANRQEGLWKAWDVAREYRLTGARPGMPHVTRIPASVSRKKSASKKRRKKTWS